MYPLLIRLQMRGLLDKPVAAGRTETFLDAVEIADLRVYKTRGTNPEKDAAVMARDARRRRESDIADQLLVFVMRFMDDATFVARLKDNVYEYNEAVRFILLEWEEELRRVANGQTMTVTDLRALRSVEPTVEHVHHFVAKLLSGPLPWARMRQAYALMRLCHKHTSARVDEVCRRALAFDVVDVRRVAGMLQNALRAEDSAAREGKLVPMPKSRFLREPDQFETKPKRDEHND